jgi:2-keto-3-deoxy-L-fuconate dehydrogenase
MLGSDRPLIGRKDEEAACAMGGKLRGKTVLITAAGRGIGRASSLAFQAAGARVVATDVDGNALATLGGEVALETRVMDVRDGKAVAETIAAIEPVHVLFNCAGMVPAGALLETSDTDIEEALDLNVRSMIRTTRAVLPGMLERRDGAIINMASVIGSVKGAQGRFAYGLTKAAVVGLTKSIAADYVMHGIRCNAICPGAVETPSLIGRFQAQQDPGEARAAFIARQPLGRLGTPEEVADLAVYLATATFTSGQVHIIDGGWAQ